MLLQGPNRHHAQQACRRLSGCGQLQNHHGDAPLQPSVSLTLTARGQAGTEIGWPAGCTPSEAECASPQVAECLQGDTWRLHVYSATARCADAACGCVSMELSESELDVTDSVVPVAGTMRAGVPAAQRVSHVRPDS